MIFIQDQNFGRKPNQPKELINELIRFPQVRLIGPDGEQLGVMSSREAQLKANELNLDLYCIAPTATPPVCKILNYGKYRFDAQKKAKEAKKNQKTIEKKEIQLTPQIGQHDLETKGKAAIKFLSEGNRVKVGVRFKGRQLSHAEIGDETLARFLDYVKEYGQTDKKPVLEGKWLTCELTPVKK